MPGLFSDGARLLYTTCKVDGNIDFFLCLRGHGSFPSCKLKLRKKGKANAIGGLKVLCGKCCVSGSETSTVPQCVPQKGTTALEGVRGGDFLFM